MKIENVEGQESLFGPGSWSGRTSPERSHQTGDGISKSSSKKQSESHNRTRPTFHVLKNGLWQTPISETDGVSPTEYSTRSFGESPKDAVVSALSQILEAAPPPKYSLSAKACQGILRRAERRGKKLPPELEAALIRQSQEALPPDTTEAPVLTEGQTS